MNNRALILQTIFYSNLVCKMTAVLSVFILVSYPLDVQWLYRPITGGAGTHPITALVFLILSVACIWRWQASQVAQLLVKISFGILAIRLQQHITGVNLLDPVVSTFSFFDNPIHGQYPIKMGLNTTMMQLFATITIFLLHRKRHWYLMQFFAIVAIFLPFVSAVGYAYGINSFYGQMSPSTTIIGCLLTTSIFGLTAHRGALKALLLPNLGAKIARIQLICGLIFCLVGGFITTNLRDEETSGFAVYVVVMCTYITIAMLASGITYEQFDKRRRILEKKLLKSAITDGLTGICNRARFDQKINDEFQEKKTGCLLLLDIDYFKNFNDTYGHLIGDKVLRDVAKLLKSNMRSSDTVCRYGGEEFTILLLNTNIHEASNIADNLRKLVSGLDLSSTLGYHSEQQITISVGCASFNQADSVKDVIKLADLALYEAKKSGRNRVYLTQDSGELEAFKSSPNSSTEVFSDKLEHL